jgi:hypothetical protein
MVISRGNNGLGHRQEPREAKRHHIIVMLSTRHWDMSASVSNVRLFRREDRRLAKIIFISTISHQRGNPDNTGFDDCFNDHKTTKKREIKRYDNFLVCLLSLNYFDPFRSNQTRSLIAKLQNCFHSIRYSFPFSVLYKDSRCLLLQRTPS